MNSSHRNIKGRRVITRASNTYNEATQRKRLPIAFCPHVLLPAMDYQLRVKDPASVERIKEIHEEGDLLGHVLCKWGAPEKIAEKAPRGDGIGMGCAAKISKLQEVNGKQLVVSYKGVRRFRVLNYEDTHFAHIDWMDDTDILESSNRQYIEYISKIEQKLYKTILDIAKFEKALGRKNYGIPDGIRRVAPPSTKTKHPSRAVSDMHIWLGRGPMQTSWTSDYNPYQAIGEQKHKFTRQELFSFAAANLVAETIEEKCVLLENRSTRAKLEWAEAAASPYLEKLKTEYSMYGIMKGNQGDAVNH